MHTSTRRDRLVIYMLVFFGGFANLATEIIGPRMFASLFGNATAIWAVIISVTLVGLSVGYALGGRVLPQNIRRWLPLILTGNALWLLAVSWFVWTIPAVGGIDITLITTTAMIAFFAPSVLFGMITPMMITLLTTEQPETQAGSIAGNLYALGTVGSVMGALSAAFFWIPWVGLSLSLRIFALLLVGFAAYFFTQERRVTAGAIALFALIVPQPQWTWQTDDNLILLAQRESYYQTVRVYGDADGTFAQMHLGPTFQSAIDLTTLEPMYNYARTLVDLSEAFVGDDFTGRNVLIIGGAGHAIAHALENRGAAVTEVELDPVVVALSDEHFGPIDGETVVMDGRAFVETALTDAYDLIIMDAFDSGTGIPPQLTTREFFREVQRILTDEGLFLSNFVGTPAGRNAGAYTAFAHTLGSVFDVTGAHFTRNDTIERQNIILAASPLSLGVLQLEPLPEAGRILTDDRNPIDILFERAREGFYYRRTTETLD